MLLPLLFIVYCAINVSASVSVRLTQSLVNSSLVQVCEGLYLVEVKVFGYDNPTGTCQAFRDSNGPGKHGCCDNPNGESPCNGRQCDSYFTYCLRPLGSEGDGCSNYVSKMSGINWNDGFINFNESPVLGLENPLLLPGLTDNYSVSVHEWL